MNLILRLYYLLTGLRNALDYPLRQAIRLKRPGLKLTNESKAGLYAGQPAAQQTAERLRQAYHLDSFYHHSRLENYRENLYYLELLERAFRESQAHLPPTLQAVDIGPASWFYVQALATLLRYWECPQGREVELRGYEADPYRVYNDLHSRYDYALAHLRDLPRDWYVPQAFSRQPARYDLALMLFPFVFESDHLDWGLPPRLFDPASLLADAWHSLKPGGWLVIVNQGPDEHQAQRAALERLGVSPLAAFRHDSDLFPYDVPRFALVCRHA